MLSDGLTNVRPVQGEIMLSTLILASAVSYVNPYVGCADNGHCFAAAAYPFGMVQAGPDTGTESWDYCSGYRYADEEIKVFSQTHISGTGCNDMGDVALMPGVVPSKYDKKTQVAQPGYYAVTLDTGCALETTVAPHSSIYHFNFTSEPKILLDLQWGIVFPGNLSRHVLKSDIKHTETEFTVWANVRNWVNREYSAVVQFSAPFTVEQIAERKFVLTFKQKEFYGKVGMSTVSIEKARKNLEAEIPAWDFAGVKAAAQAAWEELLERVELPSATLAQKQNFYTSLYHLFIQPNNIADVDGQYRGADGKVAQAKGGVYYSTLSLWDTFRTAHPLYTLLVPERVEGFCDTIIAHHKAAGFMPIWTLWGKDNQCMIGTHSVPVLVDAYFKGFKVDPNEAMKCINETLRQNHPGRGKENWDLLNEYGYYPFDKIRGESAARTLECAYDDWCAMKLAQALGRTDDAQFYAKRAQNWKNLFDKSVGLVRGRNTKGEWRTPYDPFQLGHGADTPNDFTEGNAWQYTWHVMQDPEGLMAMFGSKEAFCAKLNSLFEQPEKTEGQGFVLDVSGLIGQYAHGNEPSHHTVYFFTLAGQPRRTAELVRQVCDKFYRPEVDGLCGNDDCGQMSAWYLFSAMGFYPFNPCGGEYVLGAPQIGEFIVNKRLHIVANGLSRDAKYVKRTTLNGKTITTKLTHKDLATGGELVFEMSK